LAALGRRAGTAHLETLVPLAFQASLARLELQERRGRQVLLDSMVPVEKLVPQEVTGSRAPLASMA